MLFAAVELQRTRLESVDHLHKRTVEKLIDDFLEQFGLE
jgi:hypothetical protein